MTNINEKIKDIISKNDVVLFMNLRKKLHNEVKTSKFIIHIESTLNINLNLLISFVSCV